MCIDKLKVLYRAVVDFQIQPTVCIRIECLHNCFERDKILLRQKLIIDCHIAAADHSDGSNLLRRKGKCTDMRHFSFQHLNGILCGMHLNCASPDRSKGRAILKNSHS